MVFSSFFPAVTRPLTNSQTVRIFSPHFPTQQYPNNYYQFWELQVPSGFVVAVRVSRLDTETEADYVHIGDGVDHYSRDSTRWRLLTGNLRHTLHFTSVSSSLIIIFTSDGTNTRAGFMIECEEGNYNY